MVYNRQQAGDGGGGIILHYWGIGVHDIHNKLTLRGGGGGGLTSKKKCPPQSLPEFHPNYYTFDEFWGHSAPPPVSYAYVCKQDIEYIIKDIIIDETQAYGDCRSTVQ